ncbi:MAG TPA: dihydropteroate synthase [Burkholderiaceae bacterium]|nr:dihydropteroate synthase [Burkholderiaceae bacterium]
MPRPQQSRLQCGRFEFTLDRPLVMGIVNLTPDSFSDRVRLTEPKAAIDAALLMVEHGADILDLGGESTRPGAQAVSASEELERLLPVIEGLRGCGRPLSIDTRKPEVMREVLAAGVDMINDIGGFTEPGAIEAVAAGASALCVMHMKGQPQTMQQAPAYDDVVSEVDEFLLERVEALVAAGVSQSRIVVDPGIGFGKNTRHNLLLLEALDELVGLGQPILVGVSRKSLIGELTGQPADRRLAGSLAAALASVARGARIVRVHDVAETCDALKVWQAIDQVAGG